MDKSDSTEILNVWTLKGSIKSVKMQTTDQQKLCVSRAPLRRCLPALGLCCRAAFSGRGEWGLLLAEVPRLLPAAASPVAESGSRPTGFSTCSPQALQL